MLILSLFVLLLSTILSAEGFKPTFLSYRRQRSYIRLGWGDDIEFVGAKVGTNAVEAEGMKVLTVDVPDEVKEGYKTPGQYCQMKVGENKPGFYAIASPPPAAEGGSNTFTFLIKENENNKVLTDATPGTEVLISVPQGKGFAIEENFDEYKFDFPTMRVLMMACGSGVAPIAAAIESGQLKLKEVGYNALYARQGVLYIGARTEAHLPFKNKYKDWEDMGVTVIPVLSKPDDKWTGKEGYIQDALKEDGIEVPRNTGVLLCGQRGMVDDSKELLLGAGCYEGRLLLNF